MSQEMSAGSQLCTACGMCCDGTLFSFVALSTDEARVMEIEGRTVVPERGFLKLPQRCVALNGTACTIYDHRPFVCRKFTCLLSRALTDKELPLAEALGVVKDARAKLDRLEALLPPPKPGDGLGPVLRAAQLAQTGTPVSDEARAAFDTAQDFLRRHFVPD